MPRGFRGEKDLFRDVAKGMRIDWKQALAANYGMRNHYFGYQYKPVASLEDFDKKQLRDLYIREVIFNTFKLFIYSRKIPSFRKYIFV